MSDPAHPPMTLLVNGAPQQFAVAPTIAELLAALGMGERRVAVEVNREIVPRGRHASHRLADGDQVELVQAMGGG
jgi:sulfur carrier protein